MKIILLSAFFLLHSSFCPAQPSIRNATLATFNRAPVVSGGGGTITRIFFAHADGTSANCTTTPGTNTSGSTLLIGATGGFRSPTPGQSDSKVNSWTGLTEKAPGGGVAVRLWYVSSPTTDSAQTFSADAGDVGSTIYSSEATIGFSGATTIDGSSAGASGNSITTLQPGSRTPSQGGTVFFTAIRSNAGNTFSIDSGFTILWTGTNDFGGTFSTAFKIKDAGDSAAENPIWRVLTGSAPDAACGMSNFK